MEDWSSFGFLLPPSAGPMSRSSSLKLRSARAVWTAKFGIWKSLIYVDLQQPNRTVSSVTSADRPVLHATSPPSASLLGLQMCSVPSTIHTPSLKKRLACLHDL